MSTLGPLHALIAILVSLPAGGCAIGRTPVPEDCTDLAEIPGVAGYRCWGDEAGHVVRERLAKSMDLERQALGEKPHDPLPNAQYLALSGGGQNGAFGAGLLCGWTASGQRPTFKVVTGISTGALIAPFAFVGPEYDHVLREVYTNISTKRSCDDAVSCRSSSPTPWPMLLRSAPCWKSTWTRNSSNAWRRSPRRAGS